MIMIALTTYVSLASSLATVRSKHPSWHGLGGAAKEFPTEHLKDNQGNYESTRSKQAIFITWIRSIFLEKDRLVAMIKSRGQ